MTQCDIIDQNDFITVTQNYFKPIDQLHPGLIINERSICIDIINKKMILSPPEEFLGFELTDDDYNSIMEILRNHCKKYFGFEPLMEEGRTNFEKLQNFFEFPLWPQMNELAKTFNCNFKLTQERLNPDGYKQSLKNMGIELTENLWKRILKNSQHVYNYLVFKDMGFKDINIIVEQLDDLEERDIYLADMPGYRLENIVKFTNNNFNYLSQRKMYKTIRNCFERGMELDALELFNTLDEQFGFMDGTKTKVLKEGFTEYNHRLMNQLINRLYQIEPIYEDNFKFTYTPKEKSYQCQIDDYEFNLAPDTDFLKQLGDTMINCVYNCYRESAKQRHCLIAYATKDKRFKLCIELRPSGNTYRIEQAKAYANNQPNAEQIEALEKWIAKCHFEKVYYC